VRSRNLENEEAKARYWAVKIQLQWVVTPRKQTNYLLEARPSINENIFKEIHEEIICTSIIFSARIVN
jgi:hypothetical protein